MRWSAGFVTEWLARRRGRHLVSHRLAHVYRDAVGPTGGRWNAPSSTCLENTILRCVEEERRSEILRASRLGTWPSHSVLVRTSPGSESWYRTR